MSMGIEPKGKMLRKSMRAKAPTTTMVNMVTVTAYGFFREALMSAFMTTDYWRSCYWRSWKLGILGGAHDFGFNHDIVGEQGGALDYHEVGGIQTGQDAGILAVVNSDGDFLFVDFLV